MSIRGKIIVITGVARGLGRHTALGLKAAGATVIGIDKLPSPDVHLLDGFYRADLRQREVMDRIAINIACDFGDVDILINNAGVLTLEHGHAPVADSVLYALQVNLLAPWHLTASLLPGLLRRRGRVINISSLFALANVPYMAAYAASKRALYAYSDILRAQHRGLLDVTTVFPAFIDTAIYQPATAIGLSMKRIANFTVGGLVVFSLEEKLDAAAHRLVAICQRRPRRNCGLSALGTLAMYAARWMPSLADGLLALRMAALTRSGGLQLRPDRLGGEMARIVHLQRMRTS